MRRPRPHVKHPSYPFRPLTVRERIDLYFIPLANQVERFLIALIVGLFISVVLAQVFIFSFPEHQELLNKAIHYEGVFREDQVESKATLKHQ